MFDKIFAHIMNSQDLLNYLPGEWKISREIFNNLSPDLSAIASGTALLMKKSETTTSYSESLIVSWRNGLLTKANKNYEYLFDKNTETISLCEIDRNKSKIMFALSSNQNLFKGQYQCSKDLYKATYEILNHNMFNLLFEVKGPNKDHSIQSTFIRNV